MHIWVENFGWYNPQKPEETYPTALRETLNYINTHIQKSNHLGKPLVLEEFGLARDYGSFDPQSSVTWRDKFYREVLEAVYQAAKQGNSLTAANFWAWSGEGRLQAYGNLWQKGQSWLGDPPHERQGWYGVYDKNEKDLSTIAIIKDYAQKLKNL
jgi:mannan endo-1,4-beta-mannosidase